MGGPSSGLGPHITTPLWKNAAVHHSKNCALMSQMGHERPKGEVRAESVRLPNCGHWSAPAILALAGLTDPRVLYWEPAKWIARLRRLRTDDNMIAFRINLDAGHAGAAGRFDRLREVALALPSRSKSRAQHCEFCSM
jgi:hypothetical protein